MAIHFQNNKQPEPQKGLAPSEKLPLPPRSGLLKQQEIPDDQRLENKIRPQSLTDYIGQSSLKKSIDISIKACKKRGEPLEHILLYGPPGLGKTTLSIVLANEMAANIHITSAPALERPRDVVGILMSLQPGDVLFIDEIHRLNKVAEEILYPAMEDFALDRTIGKGHATKILRVPLPHFTLIGATTKAGSLSGPLRDRFGLVHRLNYYTQTELEQIIQRSASLLNIEADADGAALIAKRARGTPRIVNRLLRRVRDYVEVHDTQTTIDKTSALEALDLFEIDPLGLDPTDRKLLQVIIEKFAGGPVGLDTLATAIGEDSRTIEDVYEPYLVQAGLINRTPRGRVITPSALIHLGLEVTGIAAQNTFDFSPSDFS